MPDYLVTFSIEIPAPTPHQAALLCFEWMKEPLYKPSLIVDSETESLIIDLEDGSAKLDGTCPVCTELYDDDEYGCDTCIAAQEEYG